MTTDSNTAASKEPKPPQFGIRQFLFVVVLVFILFWLAQSMVRHRFHEGGRLNRHGTIVP
jgi:hypothetical protein